MPEAEQAIYAVLSGNAPITALVGGRIYPTQLPQEVVWPAISYARVSDVPARALGVDLAPTQSRFQVSAWGQSYDSAKDVASAVRNALSRYRGTIVGVVLADVFWDGETDLGFDAEARVYQIIEEFLVWHDGL